MSEANVMPSESTNTKDHKRRDAGTGSLIPPRPGISKYWAVQVRDVNGKQVRRTRFASGKKVIGKLKPGCDPSRPESWSGLTEAKALAREWADRVSKGDVSVGHDPSQLRYSDLRAMYLRDYTEQGHKSLRKTETGEVYVDCLPHLDKFLGYEQEGDEGVKVSAITTTTRDEFVAERKEAGASNGTINRSLAALRRMGTLATEAGLLKFFPPIKMLPEGSARKGFLNIEDYDKLYAALPEYVRPFLQVGFYTGMRLGEIKNLKWINVDLASNVIRLEDEDVKNSEGREIPLIDGLPEMLEKIKRANPTAEYVFLGPRGEQVVSFRKAWTKATAQAGLQDLLFHDLRRTAVRNLIRAGVSRGVAMKVSGHKTEAVFERYNITSTEDLQDAAASVTEYLKQKREEAKTAKPTKLAVVV